MNQTPQLPLVDSLPLMASPELYFFIGWCDFKATQEKLINIRKGFSQLYFRLRENLQDIMLAKQIPNGFYQSGIEYALLTADKEPLTPIPNYYQFHNAIPWKPDNGAVCDFCGKASQYLLSVEDGPAIGWMLCSEDCINKALDEYTERDNTVWGLTHGKLTRIPVMFDAPKVKLVERLSILPTRADSRTRIQKEREKQGNSEYSYADG